MRKIKIESKFVFYRFLDIVHINIESRDENILLISDQYIVGYLNVLKRLINYIANLIEQ